MTEPPLARSPLHETYATRGAEMAMYAGWHIPTRFRAVEDELRAAQTAVAVGELFDEGALDVVGGALSELAARHGIQQVTVGAAASVELPDVATARWLRLTHRHARVLTPRASIEAVRAEIEAKGHCLHVTDVSSGLTTLAVIGPRSPDLLARLIRLDLDPHVFADHTVAMTGAAGIPVQILRWDRASVLTYELTVGRDVAEYFWAALSHAGDDLGLQPIGTEALSHLADH